MRAPGRRAKVAAGSEGLGSVVIDQVLCVLCGGNRGAGGGGGRGVAVAVVVSVEALSLVLEEAVPQDGYHHHDAGGQEHRNGHFRGAWGETGQNEELLGPAQL